MRKLGLLIGAAAVVVAPSMAMSEISMRAVAFIPHKHPVLKGARDWVGSVNAALKGKLKINIIGGPEVIGRKEQWDAAKNGVIDIIFAGFSDVHDLVPEIASSHLSKCTIPNERNNGHFAHLDAQAAKLNLKLLARVQVSNFYLWTTSNAKTLADLKGRKMRTGGIYDKLMRKLGIAPVYMNAPDVYTALERGVVDGFGWPTTGVLRLGWLKKAKYVIDLPFFGNSNLGALMNLDNWKKLPADVQKTITDVSIKFEPGMVQHYLEAERKDWEAMKGKVVKIKFSPAENKMYYDAAYETEWISLATKVGEKRVAELKKLACN